MTIRDEITKQISIQKIDSSQFHEVAKLVYKQLEQQIEASFVDKSKSHKAGIHWLNMGNYRNDLACKYANNFDQFDWLLFLPTFLKTPAPRMYFVFEDTKNYQPKYWYYEGYLAEGIAILQNLPVLDYYIISKKMTWLVSENHHGIVSFVGDDFHLHAIDKYFKDLE